MTRIPGSEDWVGLLTVQAEPMTESLLGDGAVRAVVAVDFEITDPDHSF